MGKETTEARNFRILRDLVERKNVNPRDLAEEYGVSYSTMRESIDALSKIFPHIDRRYGRTVWNDARFWPKSWFALTLEKQRSSKLAIANCIAELIPDGVLLALGAGTTCFYTAEALTIKQKIGLTVFSNSLPVSVNLGAYPHCKVVIVGGVLDTEIFAASRIDAPLFRKLMEGSGFRAGEDTAEELTLGYSIMGAKRFSPDTIEIYGDHADEQAWLDHSAKHSNTIILGVDNQKFRDLGTLPFTWDLGRVIEESSHKQLIVVVDDTDPRVIEQIKESDLGKNSSSRYSVLVASESSYCTIDEWLSARG